MFRKEFKSKGIVRIYLLFLLDIAWLLILNISYKSMIIINYSKKIFTIYQTNSGFDMIYN